MLNNICIIGLAWHHSNQNREKFTQFWILWTSVVMCYALCGFISNWKLSKLLNRQPLNQEISYLDLTIKWLSWLILSSISLCVFKLGTDGCKRLTNHFSIKGTSGGWLMAWTGKPSDRHVQPPRLAETWSRNTSHKAPSEEKRIL